MSSRTSFFHSSRRIFRVTRQWELCVTFFWTFFFSCVCVSNTAYIYVAYIDIHSEQFGLQEFSFCLARSSFAFQFVFFLHVWNCTSSKSAFLTREQQHNGTFFLFYWYVYTHTYNTLEKECCQFFLFIRLFLFPVLLLPLQLDGEPQKRNWPITYNVITHNKRIAYIYTGGVILYALWCWRL